MRRFSGRSKLKYVSYQCSNRKRTASTVCRNKEIRREYLETFIMQEIARIVFDASNIPKLVKEYYKYHAEFDTESQDKLKMLQGSILSVTKKIDNIVSAVANTGSSALLNSLETYEKEREEIRAKIEEVEKQSKTQVVTEMMVELAYEYARGMYLSGDVEMHRQLLNLYLDKVVVYYDHIEFYLNTLPADILRGEIDRSLGIGENETLVEHMMRCEPQIMDTMRKLASKGANKDGAVTDRGDSSDFHRKKADKSAKNAELSTFIGGGEGNRTPVRKPLHTAFSGCIPSFESPPHRRRWAGSGLGQHFSAWQRQVRKGCSRSPLI